MRVKPAAIKTVSCTVYMYDACTHERSSEGAGPITQWCSSWPWCGLRYLEFFRASAVASTARRTDERAQPSVRGHGTPPVPRGAAQRRTVGQAGAVDLGEEHAGRREADDEPPDVVKGLLDGSHGGGRSCAVCARACDRIDERTGGASQQLAVQVEPRDGPAGSCDAGRSAAPGYAKGPASMRLRSDRAHPRSTRPSALPSPRFLHTLLRGRARPTCQALPAASKHHRTVLPRHWRSREA